MLVAISPPGCVTQLVHGAKTPVPTATYPAVRTDCEMTGVCFDGGTVFHSGRPLAKTCGHSVAPLCRILDTLFLRSPTPLVARKICGADQEQIRVEPGVGCADVVKIEVDSVLTSPSL